MFVSSSAVAGSFQIVSNILVSLSDQLDEVPVPEVSVENNGEVVLYKLLP